MVVVWWGVIADPHAMYGTYTQWETNLDLAVTRLNTVGADITFVVGDVAQNYRFDSTLSPAAVECSTSLDDDYNQVKLRLDNLTGEYHCTRGNHDVIRSAFEKYFGTPYGSWDVGGLHFVLIDTTPGTNHKRWSGYGTFGGFDERQYKSGYPKRAMVEEGYNKVDAECLEWLRADLEQNSTVPTFVGLHASLVEHPDYVRDSTVSNPRKMWYWQVYNYAEVLRTLAIGNVVCVMYGHLWYQPTTNVQTVNGTVHISGKHLCNYGKTDNGFVRYASLDTSTNSGTVYEYDLSTDTETTITTLTW